jgi:class 3 adenylate cyclase
MTSTVGDLAWRQLLEHHEHINHREVSVNRGRVVKSTGDGVLAVFETPSDAVAAARSVRTELQSFGLSIRAGIHAGEIEAHADGDISGLSVNIAARVEQAAPNGTIFVSSTVRDMMLGGEVDLLEKGEHELKGVEGLWRLYEAP